MPAKTVRPSLDTETPVVTVVLNTFNRAHILPQAIERVLEQDWPVGKRTFELVVVDDGSTDGTADVVTRFSDPRLRYVRRENGGLGAARNSGVDAARGEYIVFLDDDDEPSTEWLWGLCQCVLEPDVGIASCGTDIRSHDGSLLERRIPRNLGPAFDHVEGNFLPGCFIARTELVREVGGFYEGLATAQQTELAFRLVPACLKAGLGIATTDRILHTFHRAAPAARFGLGAKAAPLQGEGVYSGTLAVLARHRGRIARSRRMLASYLAMAGVAAVRTGRWREARSLLGESLLVRPWSAKAWLRYLMVWMPPIAVKIWRLTTIRS
jgi:glycosyltransferase involved in cell wall biosynthesis